MTDNPQIPLSFKSRRKDSFENFIIGNNELAFRSAKNFLQCHENNDSSVSPTISPLNRRFLYLKGDSGSGKTLLLNAACNQARTLGKVAIYLPLRHLIDRRGTPPEDFRGVELLCLDDLDALSGEPQWEEAVFHYLNQMRAQAAYVMLAGRQGPGNLNIELPDLRSRLAWGEVYGLKVLPDHDKKRVLQQHAKSHGAEVADEVLNYLLKYGKRDMKSLLLVLSTLQQQAFAAKRSLTVPLLREVLKQHAKEIVR